MLCSLYYDTHIANDYKNKLIVPYQVQSLSLSTVDDKNDRRIEIDAIVNKTSAFAPFHTTLEGFDDDQPAVQCMLDFESFMFPRIIEWYEARLPIPFSVKIIDNQFYVLILTTHIPKERSRYCNAEMFSCNGIQATEAFKEGTKTKKYYHFLIIQCPSVIHPSNSTLTTVSITPQNSNTLKEKTKSSTTKRQTISYDVEKLDECERKDITHFSQRRGANIKIGATTSIKKSNISHVLQWAEYHHLIGVDHMWIYVNEPFNQSGVAFPKRKYISWIPYNLNIYNYKFPRLSTSIAYQEIFRIAAQTDAIWRARRMGMRWIAMNDIDEYIAVAPSPGTKIINTNATETIKPIGSLSRYLAKLETTNPLIRSVGGIEMNSIPFGCNMQKNKRNKFVCNKNETKDILIDYVSHSLADHSSYPRGRMKMLVNPKKVTKYNIHSIGGSSERLSRNEIRFKSPADELRINHYKQADKGVFQWKRKQPLQKDSYLMDNYHDLLVERISVL